MSITIDVSEAAAKLNPEMMKSVIQQTLPKASQLLQADIKPYPPPPPNSTYIRTGRLGASWGIKVGRLWAYTGNWTPYAPYVQDDTNQAAIHRGRWKTTRDTALQKASDIKAMIEQALDRWAR